jgi:uncharacterized protein (TIGR02996 family)
MSTWTRERCPQCGSDHITGRGFDTGDGDEWQERYCFDCKFGEERMRSQGGVSWYPPEPKKPKRDTDAEQRLLDEIYAAPDDDAPRSIYADWLIEQGDKRGTFIALQLARAASGDPIAGPEEQVLLDGNWRKWLGPAAKLVGKKKHVEFERGFWSGCHGFEAKPSDWPDSLLDPVWSTVRRLALTHWSAKDCAPLVSGPLLQSLRAFTFTGTDWLDLLVAISPQPPLEEIMLSYAAVPPFRLPPPSAFPALKRIGVACTSPGAVPWLEHMYASGYRNVLVRGFTLGDEDVRALFQAGRRLPGLTFEIQVGSPIAGTHRCEITRGGLLAIERHVLPPRHFAAAPR